MRIIRESNFRKALKQAYEKGLNIGYKIGYHYKKIENCNRGAIMSGYDMDKDLQEILKRADFK